MNILGVIERLYGGAALRAEPALCLLTRSARSGCQACLEACPAGAISLAAGHSGPVVDSLACKGCGLCAAACPTGVFTVKETAGLPSRAGDGRLISVSCQAVPGEEALRVPCLAGLEPETAAAIAVDRTLVLAAPDAEVCRICPLGGHARLAGLALDAQRVLTALEAAGEIRLVYGRRAAQAEAERANQMDRRQFLSFARQGFMTAASAVVGAEKAPSTLQDLPAEVPAGRRHLLAAVRKRSAAPTAASMKSGSTHFVSVVMPSQAQAACDGCEACTRSCTCGALTLGPGDTADTLRFAADRCIACGVCVPACPRGLLTMAGTFSPAAVVSGERVTLAVLPVGLCATCGTRFRGTDDTCAECRKLDWMRSAISALR